MHICITSHREVLLATHMPCTALLPVLVACRNTFDARILDAMSICFYLSLALRYPLLTCCWTREVGKCENEVTGLSSNNDDPHKVPSWTSLESPKTGKGFEVMALVTLSLAKPVVALLLGTESKREKRVCRGALKLQDIARQNTNLESGHHE